MADVVEKDIEYKGGRIRVQNSGDSVFIAVDNLKESEPCVKSWRVEEFANELSLYHRLKGRTKNDLVKRKVREAKRYIDEEMNEDSDEEKVRQFIENFNLNEVWDEIMEEIEGE